VSVAGSSVPPHGEHQREDRTAAHRSGGRRARRRPRAELGRLLSLTVTDPAEPGDGDLEWPEERWLRAAVAARPDDVEALTLLAGRLAAQVSNWENYWANNPEGMAADGNDESTIERLQAEARDLHARILTAGPPAHAEPGLDRLAELLDTPYTEPDVMAPYSFYALEDEGGGGSMVYTLTVIATDLDEIRWACDQWLTLSEGGMGELTFSTYVEGAEASRIDLDEHRDGASISWDAVPVPELTGALLPAGLPVKGARHSTVTYYGVALAGG
jgi:hypothetical protein